MVLLFLLWLFSSHIILLINLFFQLYGYCTCRSLYTCRLVLWLMTTLSVREVWGSVPGLIKSDPVSPTMRRFFVAVLPRRYTGVMDPATRSVMARVFDCYVVLSRYVKSSRGCPILPRKMARISARPPINYSNSASNLSVNSNNNNSGNSTSTTAAKIR